MAAGGAAVKQLWLAALVVVLGLGTARADANDEAEAKRLYGEAQKAFSVGDFPEAIKDYKAAFKLVPKPGFLYNIAQSYRLSGDFKQARFFYESYLNAKPDAANRAEVEDRIREMTEEAERLQKAQTTRPTGTMPPDDGKPEPDKTKPEPDKTKIPSPDKAAETVTPTEPTPGPVPTDTGHRPIYKKWWFWTAIGAVAVVGVVAVAASGGSSAPTAPGSDLGNHRIY
jgi:tetratricopeptide (TPR) repeat protein